MKKEKTFFYEMQEVYLNIFSFLLMLLLIILTFIVIHIFNIEFILDNHTVILILILLIPYFVFHEILHSLGYVINGAKFKNITYGIHLEKSILCCSCKQRVDKKNILWSLLYPFLFIGVLTYIIGLIFNLKVLTVLSIANLAGCSGDLIMFFAFLKIKDFEFFEYDNPLAFGIVTNENLENKRFPGLKMINEKKVKQTLDKKISISKTSIIFFIIYLIILLLDVFLFKNI